MATLQETLDSLAVPPPFARHDKIADATVLAELHAWKSRTEPLLSRLDLSDVTALSTSELANFVRVLAPLTAVSEWSSPETRSLATAHLTRIPASDQLTTHILTQVVKPLFAPTPHPRFHTLTARILSRPADVQDTYVEQPWKEHPGLDEVIRWCLLNIEPSAYENIWPLFLPAIMSLLDDYQVPYKLLGVRLVSDMLTRVPPQLLLRTGVDTLMFNSLTSSLSHLGDNSTPDLIRSAVTTVLQLIDLTTPSAFPSDGNLLCGVEPQSIPAPAVTHTSQPVESKSLSIRFSRLSTLLSSSLLGTVIMYTPTFCPPVSSPCSYPFADLDCVDPIYVQETDLQKPSLQKQSFNPTLIAAAQSLPLVLSAMGIGCVCFLKGVVPVLAGWLAVPPPVVAIETGQNHGETSCDMKGIHHELKSSMADITLHLASLSSLSILFHTCTPRIGGWSMTIVDAIGRCWIGCLDLENQERGDAFSKNSLYALKKQLKEAMVQLSIVYPKVIKNECAMLLASNHILFQGLVDGIC